MQTDTRTQIFNIMLHNVKNLLQIVVHAGKDVVLTQFENGNKKATAVIATNDNYKDKNGASVKRTEWHKVVAWGKMADDLAASIQKGNEVAIHGKLSYRTYVDGNGTSRYITEIVVNEFYKIARVTANVAEAIPF